MGQIECPSPQRLYTGRADEWSENGGEIVVMLESQAEYAVGAIKRMIRERVTAYERPSLFAYEVLSGVPVASQIGTVTLEASGGGCLRNIGLHGIDVFLYLTGEDAQVTGVELSSRALGRRVEDYTSVLLRTTSGIVGTIVFTTEQGVDFKTLLGFNLHADTTRAGLFAASAVALAASASAFLASSA